MSTTTFYETLGGIIINNLKLISYNHESIKSYFFKIPYNLKYSIISSNILSCIYGASSMTSSQSLFTSLIALSIDITSKQKHSCSTLLISKTPT